MVTALVCPVIQICMMVRKVGSIIMIFICVKVLALELML